MSLLLYFYLVKIHTLLPPFCLSISWLQLCLLFRCILRFSPRRCGVLILTDLCQALCCGHTCAVKQRAAKINTWGTMGKFYSALLDAVKQRLLKSSCSKVFEMTMFAKAEAVDVAFYMVLQAAGAAQVWPVKLPQQRAFASVYILQRKCVHSIRRLILHPFFMAYNALTVDGLFNFLILVIWFMGLVLFPMISMCCWRKIYQSFKNIGCHSCKR